MPTTSARSTPPRTVLADPDPLALLPQPARESLVAAAVTAGAAGRITGLLGTYLVLVEVLLMARIPCSCPRI